jgi:hypothetical protein
MSASTERTNGHGHHAERGAVAVGAGLVPSKTTAHRLSVSFDTRSCAERRVKRLKRSVWASGHLHKLADKGHRPPVCWFVTLTYVGVNDWKADHITKAVKAFRNWCRQIDVPCRYTWVAELQRRGAVHYHLLAWLPHGVSMPHWDRTTRTARKTLREPFWPHGMTNTEQARSGVGYLMKYLSKLGELSVFPKGLRLYGIGGLDQTGKQVRSWLNLPEWAKAEYGVGDLKRVAGRLVVQATGEILETLYSVCRVPGGIELRCLREPPERFHSGPYSSVEVMA